MKKLKAALILLLALMMSLCLFACGGGEEEPPTGGGENPPEGDNPTPPDDGDDDDDEGLYRSIELDPAIIELTDSDEQTQLDQELAKVTVYATDYDLETHEFKLSDCNYTPNVTFHEVGEYSFEVSLKEDDSKKETLTVVIDHDWETQGDAQVCKYDKARQVTQKEDVVIHYGTFHEGTKATLPSGYWEEDKVYTNNKADTSIIKEFGVVDGLEVPTLTAGQLEPGMTITIKGKAMTTTDANGPWKHANEYWNSPSIGIADRYSQYQNPANNPNKPYTGGLSIIVRQEGWVLYNGIGNSDATNRLGGIMGGMTATERGGWRNYGSHLNAADDSKNAGTPGSGAVGYTKEIPTDWNSVKDYWVYSTGTVMQSGDTYYSYMTKDGKPDIASARDYEYTWNYREDGVIEITYSYIQGSNVSTLKAYIKVPATSVGYYDTIIHGDYNDMTITESVVTTKRTPKAFRYLGVTDGENTVYAENKEFKAETLNAEMQYEQTGDAWNKLQLSNSQIYYYLGNLSREQLAQEVNKEVLESTDPTVWACLGTKNALKADAIYKVHVVKGGKSFVELIPADDFTILPNNVDSAEGADVTVSDVLFANNGKLGAFDFSVKDSKILLTLASGNVQVLSEEQKAKFTALGDATRYVALRLNAAELGTALTAEGVTVKKGETTIPSIAQLDAETKDLYLVLALTEAGEYTVTGAQDTDIVLDLTKLTGFTLASKVQGTLDLNKGGELTFTYTVPAATKPADLNLRINGTSASLSYDMEENGDNAIEEGNPDTVGGCDITFVELKSGTLTIKIEAHAANYSNYAPVTVELSVGEDTVTDVIDYEMTLSAADGYIAGQNGTYAFVQESGTLSVIKAFANEQLNNGVIKGSFTLNINDGNLENFKKYGLLTVEYSYADGQLNLLGAPSYVTGYVKLLGTYGDDRDTDKGAYVVIEIDVSGLEIEGDYYFNFVEGRFNAQQAPTKITKVSGTKITEENVTANECEVAIVIEGTCQQVGLYAWAVKSDDKVIFYADAATAGGQHVNEDDDDKCDLCGSTITEVSLTYNDANQSNELHDGEFVEISGQYSGNTHKQAYNGIETSIRQASGDAFFVRVRNDGFYAREAGGDDQITLDYNSTPANTCNGVSNGIDGTAIDSATDYLDAKKNGYFKVYVSYVDGVVTVVTKLWKEEQDLSSTPYFQYTVNMTVVSKPASIKANFRLDTYDGDAGKNVDPKIETNGACTLVKGNVSNSTITEIKNAAVGGHAAPNLLTVTHKGNAVVVDGNAAVESGVYYAAFEITFGAAIDADTTVYVRKADGSTYANATATLDIARTKLSVYLPLTADVTSATIDFVNFAGNTMQGDIVIDLSKVLLSDVQVTASKSDLALTGDTFDLTYTGEYPATANITIGEDSVALSALASASESAPVKVGNSLFSVTKYDAAAKKISFKFAGISDYTKDVGEYVIALTAESGSALTRISVYTNIISGYETQLESSGWYLVAVGGTLVLVSDEAEAETLPLIVNAGKAASDANLVGVYNLGYTGGKFVDTNLATAAAVLVTTELNGKQVTAIVITLTDLTGLGITADGAYGVMLATEGATKYYAVAASRAITEQDATQGDSKTIGEHSCTTPGKSAKYNEGESFYWDFSVVPAHDYPASPDENGYYVCTTCGAILKPDNAKNITVPADLLEVDGNQTLVDTGLSISYWATVGGDDWGAHAIVSAQGNLIITLPNLDPWNNSVANVAGATEAEKALAAKVKNANKTPQGFEQNGAAWNVFLNGSSYVTITISKTEGISYYKDGVLVVKYPANTAVGTGTVADVAELMLLLGEHYGLTIASGLSSASDMIIESKTYTDAEATARYNAYVSEKDYYPEGKPAPTTPVYTDDELIKADGGLTIGTEGTASAETGWDGYTNNPNWIGKLEKGKKIVISGTQKSAATQPYFASLTVFAWSGYMPGDRSGNTGICMNHANGEGGAAEEAWTVMRAENLTGTPASKTGDETDCQALLKEIGGDCNVTITFDWTQYNKQFSIAMKIAKNDKAVEVTYTFTEKDGSTMLEAYNVGIGVDHSYAVLTDITRTEKAPTQDLPGLAYGDLNGSIVAGEFINFVKKGETLTLTGAHTATGTNTWESIQVILFTGVTPTGPKLRADRYVDDFATVNWFAEDGYQFNDGAWKIKVAVAANGTFADAVDGPDEGTNIDEFEKLSSILANSKIEIKFDWTNEAKLVVTITITDADTTDNVVSTYELVSATDAALPDQFNFKLVLGLGAAASFSNATVTPERS